MEAALFFSFATGPQCDSGPRLPFSAGGQKGLVTGPGSLVLSCLQAGVRVGWGHLVSKTHLELGVAVGKVQARLPSWLALHAAC